MCKFCIGMLTGVVLCLACLGIGLTLLHSGTISLGSTANASKDDPEPIPELADPVPVPVPSEPTPLSTPISAQPQTTNPRSSAVVVVTEAPIPETAPETDTLPAAPPVAVPPAPPEPLMPRASDEPTIAASPWVVGQPVSASTSMPVTLAVRSTIAAREPALFLGSHRCTLDEERRVKLPASVREQWGGMQTFCLTPGPDECLVICSEADLPSLLGTKLEAAFVGEALAVRRRHFACTERVKVDAEGNCRIPATLTELAGLSRDVVIIGVGAHWEIWDAQRWQQYLRQEKETAPAGASAPSSVESGPR